MPAVGGLDPSLTSFGAARASSASTVELARWRPGDRSGHVRLDWLLGNVEAFVKGCDFVVMEGAAVSRVLGGEAHLNLAGLHWLVRHRLWQLGMPYAVVSPAQRAKYITGNGRASKEDCLIAAIQRFPFAGVRGNDQADALTFAAMGLDWAGCPLAAMPAAQRAVLTAVVRATGKRPAHPAISWPVLAAA
jgi:Holliday junction resolvasome RuvABC endonuclease subunit